MVTKVAFICSKILKVKSSVFNDPNMLI